MKRHRIYHSRFTRFASATAHYAGHPLAFAIALSVIVGWAVTGPFFQFSDTWQLVINTGTTIITFLMVFLIQNSQNRDSQAMQLKLDELIRSSGTAHNALLDLEELSIEELQQVKSHYLGLAEEARKLLKRGGKDTEVVDANFFGDGETP